MTHSILLCPKVKVGLPTLLIEELIHLTNMYECVVWMRTVLPPPPPPPM